MLLPKNKETSKRHGRAWRVSPHEVLEFDFPNDLKDRTNHATAYPVAVSCQADSQFPVVRFGSARSGAVSPRVIHASDTSPPDIDKRHAPKTVVPIEGRLFEALTGRVEYAPVRNASN